MNSPATGTATATAEPEMTATEVQTRRDRLAKQVIARMDSLTTKLTALEDDIRALWVEFDNLEEGETILHCFTKKEFCEKRLHRTPRAVQYMLAGGNQNRSETVSLVSIEMSTPQGTFTVKVGTVVIVRCARCDKDYQATVSSINGGRCDARIYPIVVDSATKNNDHFQKNGRSYCHGDIVGISDGTNLPLWKTHEKHPFGSTPIEPASNELVNKIQERVANNGHGLGCSHTRFESHQYIADLGRYYNALAKAKVIPCDGGFEIVSDGVQIPDMDESYPPSKFTCYIAGIGTATGVFKDEGAAQKRLTELLEFILETVDHHTDQDLACVTLRCCQTDFPSLVEVQQHRKQMHGQRATGGNFRKLSESTDEPVEPEFIPEPIPLMPAEDVPTVPIYSCTDTPTKPKAVILTVGQIVVIDGYLYSVQMGTAVEQFVDRKRRVPNAYLRRMFPNSKPVETVETDGLSLTGAPWLRTLKS